MASIKVDECPAGLEMDAAIEAILGHPGYFSEYIIINDTRYDIRTWIWDGWNPENPPAGWRAGQIPRPFSRNIAAAWELADPLLKGENILTYIEPYWTLGTPKIERGYDDDFWIEIQPSAVGRTVSLAICRTFLKANGVTEIDVD